MSTQLRLRQAGRKAPRIVGRKTVRAGLNQFVCSESAGRLCCVRFGVITPRSFSAPIFTGGCECHPSVGAPNSSSTRYARCRFLAETAAVGDADRMWRVFRHLYGCPKIHATTRKIKRLVAFLLTFPQAALGLGYHLRSTSGSNGLETKDSSPLLDFEPILLFVARQRSVRTLPVEWGTVLSS